MNSYDFTGRTIVVTGGAGDIGLACAGLLVAGGAHAHLVDPRGDALDAAAAALGAGPGRATTHCSALEDPAACAAALDSAGAAPDALIHLAGVYEPDPFDPAVTEVWERAIRVNLTSAYDMAAAFAALRAKRDDPAQPAGRMIFTTSIAAGRGSPDQIAYSSAKAGLHGLVRSLAGRLAPDVLVNAVAPGVIETRMTTRLIAERGAGLRDATMLGRLGRAEEVAHAIAFLCSDGASYITGQILQVDGGMVLR